MINSRFLSSRIRSIIRGGFNWSNPGQSPLKLSRTNESPPFSYVRANSRRMHSRIIIFRASHKARSKICVQTCNWHVRVLWLIQGQGEDRIRLRPTEILDTWNTAKLRFARGVELMPSADFQNYCSTASAVTVFVFVPMVARCLTYFSIQFSNFHRPSSFLLWPTFSRVLVSPRVHPCNRNRCSGQYRRACPAVKIKRSMIDSRRTGEKGNDVFVKWETRGLAKIRTEFPAGLLDETNERTKWEPAIRLSWSTWADSRKNFVIGPCFWIRCTYKRGDDAHCFND